MCSTPWPLIHMHDNKVSPCPLFECIEITYLRVGLPVSSWQQDRDSCAAWGDEVHVLSSADSFSPFGSRTQVSDTTVLNNCYCTIEHPALYFLHHLWSFTVSHMAKCDVSEAGKYYTAFTGKPCRSHGLPLNSWKLVFHDHIFYRLQFHCLLTVIVWKKAYIYCLVFPFLYKIWYIYISINNVF